MEAKVFTLKMRVTNVEKDKTRIHVRLELEVLV